MDHSWTLHSLYLRVPNQSGQSWPGLENVWFIWALFFRQIFYMLYSLKTVEMLSWTCQEVQRMRYCYRWARHCTKDSPFLFCEWLWCCPLVSALYSCDAFEGKVVSSAKHDYSCTRSLERKLDEAMLLEGATRIPFVSESAIDASRT